MRVAIWILSSSSNIETGSDSILLSTSRTPGTRATSLAISEATNGIRTLIVSLTGKVRMPFVASEIAKLVARVPGVREVDNKIESLPVSMFDDELRIQIATRIYRDPL